MGPVTECPPSVLAQRICPLANPRGVPRGYAPLVAGRMSEKGRQGAQRTLEGGRRSAFPSKDTFPPVGNPFRCGRCGGALRATHPLFIKEIAIITEKKMLTSRCSGNSDFFAFIKWNFQSSPYGSNNHFACHSTKS